MIGEQRRGPVRTRRLTRSLVTGSRPRGRAPHTTRPTTFERRSPATTTTTDAPVETHRPLGYLPSLDGIRALAVAAVFAFHAGFGWATGGFLGVSVFFTLSGFLITRLLLDESFATRSIDLLRFWARRLRRLLPAAIVAVVLVLVLAATVLRVSPESVRGDVLATLGYVANWRFLFSGQSYSALFTAPSPLLHFWSLAIEEQFYLFFPIIVAVIVRVRGRDRARTTLRWVVLGGIALSIGATVLAVSAGNGDFVYYSTITRAAELLAGALLACSLAGATLPGAAGRRWPLPVGLGAVVAIGFLCVTTSKTTGWVTHGGLTLFSLLSVALIAAALPRGPFSSVLSIAPLRGLGKISYGVYLFHWPVILWLDADRVGVSGWALAGVQAAVTLAVAITSYYLIERPIRRGGFVHGTAARVAGPIAIAAACIVALVATSAMTAPAGSNFEASAAKLDALTTANADSPVGDVAGVSASVGSFSTPTTDSPSKNEAFETLVPSTVPFAPAWDTAAPAPRVAIVGDSTAIAPGLAMFRWGNQTGALRLVGSDVGLSCSIARAGLVRYADRAPNDPKGTCGDWGADWVRVAELNRPDVAVIMAGPIDLADRQLPGEEEFRAIGDPVYNQYLESEMLAATDLWLSRGIQVVWVTTPRIESGHDLPPHAPFPESDPDRMRGYNRMLRDVARQRPGVHVVDFRTYLRQQPGGELDWSQRPDGVHFANGVVEPIVAGWLAPAILSAVRPLPAAG